MNEQIFWAIIQSADDQAQGSMYAKCEAIKAEIAKLSEEDAKVFAELFDAMMDKAYTWPLWGAAYLINGGCEEDAFADFRALLISRGQQAFEQAVTDPDSLADGDFDEYSWVLESYEYAVSEGVEAVLGSEPERKTPAPTEPAGEKWAEEKLSALYPKISNKLQGEL